MLLATAVILAGCSFDANELKAFPVLDSSAVGRSSLDDSGTHDSPTTAMGGADGAATTGGTAGGFPDGPSAGTGGAMGTGGIINTGGIMSLGGTMSTGGTTRTGGATGAGGTTVGVTGTGGTTTPDAGPDVSRDLPSAADTGTLSSGLRVYYKCENATGTTLPDSSGNGNNGTLAGTSGYTFPAGKVGNALALAKAGQGYVSIPAAVFANATDITIATWVNVTTSQSWAHVFDVGVNANLANNTASGTRYMNLLPKNGGTNLAFAISKDGYNNEQVLTATALATGTWKHVAVVLSSGQGTLYVDGAAAGSSAISLRPVDLGTIDYAYLGKSQFSADPYFDGQIDEFRVYGRALSAAEIKALYQFTGS